MNNFEINYRSFSWFLISNIQSLPQELPQQVPQQPPPSTGDLRTGINNLANGARTTAFLLEEGGNAGADIISQFGQLFRE